MEARERTGVFRLIPAGRTTGREGRLGSMEKKESATGQASDGAFFSVATRRDHHAGANSLITWFGLGAVLAIACPCQVAQSTWTRQGSPPFHKGTSGGTPADSSGPRSKPRVPPWTLPTGPSRKSSGRSERKLRPGPVQGKTSHALFTQLDLAAPGQFGTYG